MKKRLFIIVVTLFASLSLWAQAPQRFTYQAAVRDANGRLLASANVGVRLSILQGGENGQVVYSQNQTVHTNANGLFSIIVGGDSMENIDWGTGSYFLRSEVDPDGGINYSISTVQQILSVPYAIRAHTVDSIIGGVNYTETDPVFSAWDKDYNDLINRPVIPTSVSELTNDAGYLTSFTEVQALSISNDTIYLTGGSFVKIPAGFSGDYDDLTNKPLIPVVPDSISAFVNDAGYLTSFTEVQALSISNDTIYLTGGSFVKIPAGFSGDYDDLTNKPVIPIVPDSISAFVNDAGYLTSYTESQILSISNDTIYLTGGSFVKIPAGFSGDYDDLTNKPIIPVVPDSVSAFVNDAGYLTSYTESQVLSISNDTIYLTGGSFVKIPTGFSGDYNDLTNKPTIPTVPTNIGAFTNDAGYLTSYIETQTLANVTALGNSANSQIKNLSDPTDDMDAVNKRTMDSSISVSVSNAVNSLMLHYDSIIAEQQHTIDSLERSLDSTIYSIDTSATACNSFVWHGTEYTASGNYTHLQTFPNNNHVVIFTLHLTINNPMNTAMSQTACESYTWESGDGNTYTATGDFVFSHVDINGCQQADTLHLVIHHSTSGDTTASAIDSFTWHGNTYTESGNHTHILTNVSGCDSVVTLNLTINLEPFTSDGATRSVFTVSSTGLTVRFSRGNLQYKATGSHATADGGTAQGIWRFAENQYDIIGAGNVNISSSYNDWIDLFGWGTAGWNNNNIFYNPWSTGDRNDLSSRGYGPLWGSLGSYPHNLLGNYANSDWGVYNAISNGGNIPNYWRTLTNDEWNYLLNTRNASTVNNTDNARYTKAQVSGRNGVILFPDYYTHPNNVMLPTNINNGYASYNTNIYTTNDWEYLEAAGCVFLPAAGRRTKGNGDSLNVSQVEKINEYGEYWASTWFDVDVSQYFCIAYDIFFTNSSLYTSYTTRILGLSVRLVHDCD